MKNPNIGTAGGKTEANSFARDTEHKRYKNFCDNPPPPTGDRCQDLRNMINYHKTCADMREEWDKRYSPGEHFNPITTHRRMQRKYQRRLDNAWDCREQCE